MIRQAATAAKRQWNSSSGFSPRRRKGKNDVLSGAECHGLAVDGAGLWSGPLLSLAA